MIDTQNRQNRQNRPRRRRSALLLALPLALVGGCAGPGDGARESEQSAGASSPSKTTGASTEQERTTPRLVLSHDGGVVVLDATTLESVGEVDLDGFVRPNDAGDGRHVVLSTTGGFQVLDAGTWSQAHGDHAHHRTADPVMTDAAYRAGEPGHVVAHEGRTALFDDATGEITVLDSGEVADAGASPRRATTATPHHGFAVELGGGRLLVSEGTAQARTGIRVLDRDDRVVAASDECAGVHGETTARDEAVAVGCQDGALVYDGEEITKVASPDADGRISSVVGTDSSSVVLGNYSTGGEDAGPATRVSLIDTADATLRVVDLPTSYSYWSLARGEDGEALVLGTDGALHVVDPATGALVRSVPVVQPWTEPEDWQEPRPAVEVLGGTAYVTEPASSSVHAVDVATGEVVRSARLDVVPHEMTAVSGDVEDHGGHAHQDG